jgi:nickel-dependent lactate racemase
MFGYGSATTVLGRDEVASILADGLRGVALEGKKVLVLVPDSTRHAPIPLMFELLAEHLGKRAAELDYLVALGTHPAMDEDAIDALVGLTVAQRAQLHPGIGIENHAWDDPAELAPLGVIPARDVAELTQGLLSVDVPVALNRRILDADHIVICGPVFPHEVAGFSGGAKYLFPGIAGPEIIDATHWLGALVTSSATIGVKDTPVRKMVHRAAELVPRPITCIALAVSGDALHGVYVGGHVEAWSAAADLAAELGITTVSRPYRRVLSMPSPIYDDLWTAAKAMYKTEPAIADGGEVVIYAPHLTEISYTHAAAIEAVGYHVRDYFTLQPGRFDDVPGMIKAHSTHVKGLGSYDPTTGVETPRIAVTLATGIPEWRCRAVNLGFLDHREVDPAEWEGREDEGVLVVRNAGEMLYRVGPTPQRTVS